PITRVLYTFSETTTLRIGYYLNLPGNWIQQDCTFMSSLPRYVIVLGLSVVCAGFTPASTRAI
ncbi:MAG: hypothetical protein ABR568_23550, partial [Pyrinomonadaceae bacterium]